MHETHVLYRTCRGYNGQRTDYPVWQDISSYFEESRVWWEFRWYSQKKSKRDTQYQWSLGTPQTQEFSRSWVKIKRWEVFTFSSEEVQGSKWEVFEESEEIETTPSHFQK